MVQNNKVLTVSYGTFSCTLEGFEDSFDTMKAIAEYFRDLASDDRYFGAEPPQPDADMLARIAQKEIDRQVEARTSEGAVHLRAAEKAEPASPPPTVSVPAVAEAPAAPVAPAEPKAVEAEPVVEQPTEPAAAAAPIETAPAEETPEVAAEAPQDIAAEIVEDAAEVSEPVTETVEPVETALVAEPQAEEPAADQSDDGIDLAAVAAAVAAPAETQAETVEVEDLPPAEDLVAEVEVAVQSEVEDDATPAADSIAAKLQRIRAVVAQAPQEEEFSEDQHADNFIKESAVDIAAAMRLDDEAELAAEQEQETEDQIEISEALDRIDQRQRMAEEDLADEVAEEALPETEAEVEAEVEAQVEAEPLANVEEVVEVEDNTSSASDAQDDSSLFEDLEAAATPSEAEGSDEDANILAEVAAQTEPAETVAKSAPEKPVGRARIMRVKRSQLDAAVQAGTLEEIKDDDDFEEAPKTSLTDVEEADLLRELAAVEAELLASDKAARTTSAEETPETASAPATSEPARPAATAVDSDVSRLMDAADEKLEDPELSSSRETYDHLRAAMAAAQADRAAGGTAGSGSRDDPYRQDLASVVRPRRPAPTKTVSQRPETASRPAPLKLVAEQRIDETPVKPNGPIRPRRIAASQESEADFAKNGQEGGFAKYASESGAVELSELLEAAASYMSFVEGRDHFSRPQLMNKVKLLDSAEFNREDGLRSFGQLLREGKIEKTNSGYFTASGEIGFRPDERVAG